MDNKNKLVHNILWSISGQLVFMMILFFTNILLAKKLSPIEFGQIGIVMFFINLFNVLIESGFGGALVRKEETDEADFDTVFVFNLIVSITLYFILIISSSSIARFYEDASLKNIIIFSGFILLINSFQITQNTRLIKELKFKQISLFRTISVFSSSVVGIVLAYRFNLGVWSIVIMQILNVLINTLFLNIAVGKVNRFRFSKQAFSSLYRFGLNTTIASVLNTVFENIYNLVLGKYFGISQSGFFYQAKKIQDVPINLINSLNHGVIFSTLAKNQNHPSQFYIFYKGIFRYFIFVVGFTTFGLFLFAKDIILLVLGDRWLTSYIYVKYLSAFSFFFLLEQYNRVVFKVFNRTEKILYLEVVKKLIQTFSIILGVILNDILILMQGLVVTSILSYSINFFVAYKNFDFVKFNELMGLIKVLLISFVIYLLVMVTDISLLSKAFIYIIFFLVGGQLFQLINIYNIKKFKK